MSLTPNQSKQWNDFHRGMDWFNSHQSELTKAYDKKLVAISNCSVIDSDADLTKLLARLHKHGYDTSGMVIEPVDSSPPHLILTAT